MTAYPGEKEGQSVRAMYPYSCESSLAAKVRNGACSKWTHEA